jgi:hypothetical protein
VTRGHGKSKGLNFFYGKGNQNRQLGKGLLVHHRIISAVKSVKSVSNRVSYIVLRGRGCNIILNVHAPSEKKSDDSTVFVRSWSRFSIIFLSTI